ncbi:MAG: PhnD/SsuA/transferrin family substrate-binding protein [Anaerolineae bacterium]|nr:PhnD/SsuA/transferrin family substrate-binding protein [Candidatus Roseilinea sp.]MDW8448530.1 PhnD/SsuA/transferrin family substrate-binding protein [Anaerolineae bacterium]
MTLLTFTTCQAAIAEPMCADVVHYLAGRLNIETRFIADIVWEMRERLLYAGRIDAGWICGAPYVRAANGSDAPIELLAAPVFAAPRYQDRPIYFSDVVVRRNSMYRSFADLRGARWVYNNHGSHSGYEIVRYHLARLGLNGDFFGQVIVSGAHQRSVEMILNDQADAAAIDSTVLEMMLAREPALAERLRVIEVLGPSSQPPWVIGRHVPAALRQALRAALIHMHEDAEGRIVLARHRLARFAPVTDSDYDDVREMLRIADARGVQL